MGRLFHILGFLALLLLSHVTSAVPARGGANAGTRPPVKSGGNTHGSGQRGPGGPEGPFTTTGQTDKSGGTPGNGAAESTVQDHPTTSNEMANGSNKPKKEPSSFEPADVSEAKSPEAGTTNEKPKGRRPQEAKPGDDDPGSSTSTTAVTPLGTDAAVSAATGGSTTMATVASPSSSPSMSPPAPVDRGSGESNTSGVTGRRSELSLLGFLAAVGVGVTVC